MDDMTYGQENEIRYLLFVAWAMETCRKMHPISSFAVWFFEPSNHSTCPHFSPPFGSRDTTMAAENNDRNSKFLLYQTIRWTIYGSLFVGYSSYYFCRKSYTFAIPALIGELSLKKNELGVITSGFAAMYGVGKFSCGLLSDSLSPRTMFTTGMLLTGIINILIGFSGNLWLLTFLWSVNGLFQGCGWPPCTKLLREWFSSYEVCIFAVRTCVYTLIHM